MAMPSDLYRKEQLFCSFAKPNHPATKFTWGNLVTLRDSVEDDKLYEELHKFRQRHYSAHRMTLAIQVKLKMEQTTQPMINLIIICQHYCTPPLPFLYFQKYITDDQN